MPGTMAEAIPLTNKPSPVAVVLYMLGREKPHRRPGPRVSGWCRMSKEQKALRMAHSASMP
jgi:hypothetical protein